MSPTNVEERGWLVWGQTCGSSLLARYGGLSARCRYWMPRNAQVFRYAQDAAGRRAA